MPADITAVLDSITAAHNLESTKQLYQQQHPAYGTLHIAVVTVNHQSHQATDGNVARAQEQAAGYAVAALESQGYLRPPRHYRTEINNIGNRYGMRVKYADQRLGPPHNCTWISTVCVDGTRRGSGAEFREKGAARESAARRAVEYFESLGY